MSSELRFRPSSPRYGYFSVSAHGTRPGAQTGPFGVQRTPFSGANGSKHGRKRTQTLLNCILSINNGNRTSHGAPWRHHGPFLAFLGHFWPQNFSKCPGGQNTSKSPIPAGGGSDRKKSCSRESCGKASWIAWSHLFSVLGPLPTTTARFLHFWAIFGPRISLSARVAKIRVVIPDAS